ncbi:MAG TPA: Mth938-like domain-containing protein [Methylibium sp.]|uniref:Mth938-like domain-containing protein n=1 Tax=Methylibium sp. TaxID=2067992 RepID=UPI002DB95702|nr:Mth938-like domain-containing protein [Methylibium sp.]HEU4460785.1 Mth938-like domain-containing protein [Methylibium sp.]
MKLQADPLDAPGLNLIARYDAHGVQLGERVWRESLVLPWQGEVRGWPVASFDALRADLFEPLVEHDPEIVLFGSGPRLRFPRPEWTVALMRRRIGFETMDLSAACRTYNLLAAEGRRVVAALLIEAASS